MTSSQRTPIFPTSPQAGSTFGEKPKAVGQIRTRPAHPHHGIGLAKDPQLRPDSHKRWEPRLCSAEFLIRSGSCIGNEMQDWWRPRCVGAKLERRRRSATAGEKFFQATQALAQSARAARAGPDAWAK